MAASFEDYYNKAMWELKASGQFNSAPRQAPRRQTLDFSNTGKGIEGSKENQQDFLSWLTDIASRPLFAVTETADSLLDVSNKKRVKKREKEGLPAILGDIGEVVSAPVRGFFSTNKDDKRYSGEIMEKVADTVGSHAGDPDKPGKPYEDVENNVDPTFKGVFGFAGDVLADPLTWIPGAQMAKVGQLISKGGRDVAKAAGVGKKVAQGAKVVEDVADAGKLTRAEADTALEQADLLNSVDVPERTPVPIPEPKTPVAQSPIFDKLDKLTPDEQFNVTQSRAGYKPFEELSQAEMKAHTPDGPYEVVVRRKGGELVERFGSQEHALLYAATLPKSAKHQIRKPQFNAKGEPVSVEQQVAEQVDSIPSEAVAASAPPPEVPVTPVYRPKPPSEQLAEHAKVPMIRDFLEGLSRSVPEGKAKALSYDQFVERFIANAPDSSTVPNYMAGVTPGAPKRVPTSSLRTDKEALDSQAVQRYLKAAYQQWQKSHESVVDKLMKPNTKAVITEGSRQDNFAKLLQTAAGVARAEELLGIGLVNRLKRKESAETFDRLVKEISNVLDRGERLDKITESSQMSSVTKALMGQLKIDVVGTNLDIIRADSKVAEMADLSKAAQAAKEAMVEPEAGIRPVVDDVLEKMSTNREDRLALMNDDEREAVSWLPRVIHDNFFSNKYVHHTLSGIGRTSDQFAEGQGRAERLFNQWTQWDILQAVTNRATEKIGKMVKDKTLSLPGSKHNQATTRALAVKAEVERKMRTLEKMFDNEGFQMWMGTKDDVIPLTTTQMLHALEDAGGKGINSEKLLKYFYNAETRVPTTNVMDAVVKAHAGADAAMVRAELTKTMKRNVKPGHMNADGSIKAKYRDLYRIPNPMMEGRGYFGFYGRIEQMPNQLANILETLPPGVTLTPKVTNGKVVGWYRTFDPDYLADQLTQIIMDSRPILDEVVGANAAALKARIGSETAELTDAELTKLQELVSSDTNIVKAMQAVTDIEKDHETLARSAGALYDSEMIAKVQIDQAVNPEVRVTTESFVAGAEAGKRAGKEAPRGKGASSDKVTSDARKRPLQKGADEVQASTEAHTIELLQSAAKTAPGTEARAVIEQRLQEGVDELVDISATTYASVDTLRDRIFAPLRKLFDADYGMPNAYQFMHSMGNASNTRRAKMMKYLNDFSKKHQGFIDGTQTKILTQAFRDIQSGAKTFDQQVAMARVDMEELIAPMLSPTNPNSIFGGVFFRTPTAIHRLNESLQGVGISHQFDIALAERMMRENGTDFLTEVVGQWKLWDGVADDPLDFINRIYVAAEQIATDAAVVQNLTSWALRPGNGFASKVPRPGYVKMTASGDSRYFDMLDHTLYWDKELANEFGIMDQVSRMSKTFDGEFGKFIHGPFDVVQGAWKYAITLPRPGHHIRNMVGDMSMTFVAEGMRYFRRSSVDAFKILGVKGSYNGLDINRALAHMGEQLPDAGEVLSKGRFGNITTRQAVDAMMSNGLTNSYHAMEDLADVSSPMLNEYHKGKFARGVGRVFLRGGRIERVAASVSEGRDHLVRAQHFMQYIHKAQKTGKDHLGRPIKNTEELFRMAARQVKKHHPDGSMLTPFESKVMRRIIPFYSWVRGALPAIIEGALLHPGRTMVFPKASYNLAIGMGIDPDSLYDPFPDDQLFPSFLTEQVFGPQFQLPTGEYLGVNPGVASADVANMFGADPVRGIAGSVSPLIRMGPELLSGATWGTGTNIRDTSDYFDQTLPGINYLANVSGVSPTGSVGSILGGKGLDPQAQVAAGNKSGLDQQLSIVNWLLGMNVSNQSRPNFINYAEIEKRNREAGK